jgi:hypothetical protein
MDYGIWNMEYGIFTGSRHLRCYLATAAFLFAALARFFCLGFGLVLPAVPRDIFPRFER